MDDQNSSRLEFVTQEASTSRAFFQKKRNYNRLIASTFVGAAASLSAVATVSLGASKMTGPEWLALVALIASGLATISGALEALLAHRKLWHINNAALASLDELKLDMSYRKTDPQPLTTAEVDGFYQRFKTINSEADQAWVRTYSPK